MFIPNFRGIMYFLPLPFIDCLPISIKITNIIDIFPGKKHGIIQVPRAGRMINYKQYKTCLFSAQLGPNSQRAPKEGVND